MMEEVSMLEAIYPPLPYFLKKIKPSGELPEGKKN
jgi:hypothetical protein